MPTTISTDVQTRWADSFASSVKVGLTVRANGEEAVQIITSDRQLIPAYIAAPTVAPIVFSTGFGVWPGVQNGWYGYYYVYASTKFPNVEAVTTAGGEVWVKGQPSPPGGTFSTPSDTPFNNTSNNSIYVRVRYSLDPNIDQILIYRTSEASAAIGSDQVLADLAAGNLFYVGSMPNAPFAFPGITTIGADYEDVGTSGQEAMELDNYPAPQFWHVVYESPYWWGFGNPDFVEEVYFNGTSLIAVVGATWFNGRNGQSIYFDGITTGGADGKGMFYFQQMTDTQGRACLDVGLTMPYTFPYSGTTTCRMRGFTSTLYRSKPNNPFAWGFTQDNISTDGDGNQIVEQVPQEFALEMGGGHGVAIAVVPSERLLKLDCENPPRCYTLNLAFADQDQFGSTKRVLDGSYVVTSQKSQFYAGVPNGETALRGIDVYNQAIVQASAGAQGPVSSPIFRTLRTMVQDGNYPRNVHGAYDPTTEISTWWIKTQSDPGNLISIDTALVYHGPSNQWSLMRSFDITASELIYDQVTLEAFVMLGTGSGQLLRAYLPGNYTDSAQPATSLMGLVSASDGSMFSITSTSVASSAAINGLYFVVNSSSVANSDLWYFHYTGSPDLPPPNPGGGRVLRIQLTNASETAIQIGNIIEAAMVADPAGRYQRFSGTNFSNGTHTFGIVDTGPVGNPNQGTAAAVITAISKTSGAGQGIIIQDGNFPFNTGDTGMVGTWVMLTDASGNFEQYARIASFNTTTLTCDIWATVNDGDGNKQVTPAGVTALPTRPAQVGDRYYVGVRDCGLRNYFAPESDIIKQVQELWTTQEQVDSQGFHGVRFYQSFSGTDGGQSSANITLNQQTTDADIWKTSSGIPSAQLGQFGLKFIERGYKGWRMVNISPKVPALQ